MMILERIIPKRKLGQAIHLRWPSNFGIVIIDTLLLGLFLPLTAVQLATWSDSNGIGLLNMFELPRWLSLFITRMIMDLATYWQHRLFHKIPIFWRIHRLHHADLDFDVSTALRFHPIEIGLSMIIKFFLIFLLGPDPSAVMVFEICLNVSARFNHSNIYIPKKLDHILKWIIVTPDMHSIHHSTNEHDSNLNFGFNFPWWDRIFLSYARATNDR